jgi:hypothetical protein
VYIYWGHGNKSRGVFPSACKLKLKTTFRGLSPRANYTDRSTAASAKLVPTWSVRGCHVVSVTDPYARILCFLDRSRYFFFQVAQLYSRSWVDPVPDPLLLRKSGSLYCYIPLWFRVACLILPKGRNSSSGRGKIVVHLVQADSGAHPASYPGAKATGPWSCHSPPTNAEIEDTCICTSTHP